MIAIKTNMYKIPKSCKGCVVRKNFNHKEQLMEGTICLIIPAPVAVCIIENTRHKDCPLIEIDEDEI